MNTLKEKLKDDNINVYAEIENATLDDVIELLYEHEHLQTIRLLHDFMHEIAEEIREKKNRTT